jgi:type III pantothenate kinase
MLLALDIGNTAMKFGVFEGDELVSKFVLPSSRDYGHDDLRRALTAHFTGVPTGVIFSSVVPEIDAVVNELFLRSGIAARQVTANDDLGLTFPSAVDHVGTDRLVNSFAAAERYGVPCIVVSLGTATTIDVVNDRREYLGGLIAPGPKMSAKALDVLASKLPEVEIAEPVNIINASTVSAIQAGIFYGQVGLIDSAIPHIKAEIGGNAKVIATGGFAPLIANKCASIDTVEPDLTLYGLKMLYSRA